MWLVRLALRRPYSVATFCLAIMCLGILAITRMKTDVLPAIDIPVVVVVWQFPGLSAQDMENRVTYVSERGYSTTVDNIDHIESESINGIGVVKIYMAQDANIGSAIGQITAQSMQSLRFMPPGMQPPSILQFNASNVQVAQLTVSSESLSAQEMFDYSLQFLRLKLFTIEGIQIPPPYGGSVKQVSIDIDPAKLTAKQLAPQDVVNAILASNVILPAGVARMDKREYDVEMNGGPPSYRSFDDIPLKVVDGATVHLGDVASAHAGYGPLFNIVHVNGKRAVYIAVLKKSNASTLAVVDATRDMIPSLKAAAPQGLELKLDFDQSVFVRAAVWGVLREALLSAGLIALMVFAFLGSGKSVLVACTSIPLAVMCAVIGLFLSGQTLNLMTLGGLALSVGMLVDDATVEIENIHRNLQGEKRLAVAILTSANQVATPALATTITICVVFFPVVLLTGPARFLFIPLALAVTIAMVASYLLSRTLVPAMSHLLMRSEHPIEGDEQDEAMKKKREEKEQKKKATHHGKKSLLDRFNEKRDRIFEKVEDAYEGALRLSVAHRWVVLVTLLLLVGGTALLAPAIGLDFFPTVDTGMVKLHLRAPAGTRLEETELISAHVQQEIRKIIPEEEIETINDNIGSPIGINLGYIATDNVNSGDADILIALKPKHHPQEQYIRRMRDELPPKFPGSLVYFQSADVISQVLNFGVSAPIDVEVQGRDVKKNYEIATQLMAKIREVPGAVDVHIPEVITHPALQVDVDRERSALIGLSERDVAQSLLTSLSGSALASPSFWVDPANHVNYQVAVQTPLEKITSVQDLMMTPLTSGGSSGTGGGNGANTSQNAANGAWTTGAITSSSTQDLSRELTTRAQAPYLGTISKIRPVENSSVAMHYTAYPIIDVQCAVDGRDLGGVARDVQKIVDGVKELPKGTEIHIRGQSQSMFQSFGRLALGLGLAIVLVYLLLVTLLQSWLDPFVIMIAIPGALIGVAFMLALTGTTLNVESLMGTIMVVGIAVSNSNLLVNFANDLRTEKKLDAKEGAIQAAKTRLRPVLMTALAMLFGMLPMAFAMGEGGEQNAPLGRAVIGGLLVATFVTLFAVPVLYTMVRKGKPSKEAMDERFEKETGEKDRGKEEHDGPSRPAPAS